MDQKTVDAISSVMSYLSTPVGSAPVIIDASKGEVFDTAFGTVQTLVSFGEMIGKRAPGVGGAVAFSALGLDLLSMEEGVREDGKVEVSDIYSSLSNLSAIIAAGTLAAAVGAASAPALIATAVIVTAAGAVLTVMAMNSGDDTIDLNPAIESLKSALHALGEILGEAYTTAIDALQSAMNTLGDYGQAFSDYVTSALSDIADAVSSSILSMTDSLVAELRNAYNVAMHMASPLVLDLDGDGVETLSSTNGIHFDHDGNGFAETTGWVGKDDGLLVWDRNGNGQIDDGSELFGSYSKLTSGQNAANGFVALADLDSNHDGKVDSTDVDFGKLRVWKDGDSDAEVDSGELLSLGEVNVDSLSVSYVGQDKMDAQGNKVLQVGTFIDVSGVSRELSDIWFGIDGSRTIDLNKVPIGTEYAYLPDMGGFGNVSDLSQAMLRDSSGNLRFLVERFSVEADATKRQLTLDQIIFAWSGVADYSSTSRGGYIDDGRKLYALEAFLGQPFLQLSAFNNPGPNSAAKLMLVYDQLAGFIYGGLMLQTHFKALIESVDLSLVDDEIVLDVASLVGVLRTAYVGDSAQATQMMVEFARALTDAGGAFGLSLLAGLRQAGDVNAPGFSYFLANFGYSLGGLNNDELYGDEHNNTIFGLAGQDTLYGGAGNDTLEGGEGNDYLSGDTGSDIYLFNRGWGQDTLNNFDDGVGKSDLVEFGADIAPAEIVATRSGDNLILALRGGADRVKVVNYFYHDGLSAYHLEGVRFADGTIWGLEQIKVMVVTSTAGDDEIHGYGSSDNLNGELGNDSLYGSQGDDAINGGGGNDYLEGGTGSDVYYFNLGDGQDVINESSEIFGDIDVLHFGEGIHPEDINVSLQGASLILRHGNNEDQVTIFNWFNQIYSRYQVERIEFADGTVWTSAELTSGLLNRTGTEGDDVITGANSQVNHNFLGGGGNDTLTTGAGNDQLEGGTGNDILNGGAGSDTYLFNLGDGQDVINDSSNYSGGIDVLKFGAGILASDIAVSRAGNNLVLNHSNGLDRVTVNNWLTSTGDLYQLERIEFADGTVWTSTALSAQLLHFTGGAGDDVLTGVSSAFNQVLSGGGGNDTLTAGAGNDQLEGGTGNDTLNGGTGSDVYLFALGDGQDILNDDTAFYSGNVDVLRFGAGISASDIT
ncbi:calcium-binding protein, partial [Pseudomonas fluorescens]